jgi:putative transcriptional regulator
MNSNLNKGDFLISYPYLEDDYFYRSVICLMEHNDEGSFGLIINRKMPYKIGDAYPLLSHLENYLYMGGPVETNSLFFIHPYKDLKDTISLGNDLYWNGDILELKDMLELEFARPEEIRFFLGYSGWGVNQLMEEMEEKSWLIGPQNNDLIFDDNDGDITWRLAVESLGDEFKSIAHAPFNPNLN